MSNVAELDHAAVDPERQYSAPTLWFRRIDDNGESDTRRIGDCGMLAGAAGTGLPRLGERAGRVSVRRSPILQFNQARVGQRSVSLLSPGKPREAEQSLPRRPDQSWRLITEPRRIWAAILRRSFRESDRKLGDKADALTTWLYARIVLYDRRRSTRT